MNKLVILCLTATLCLSGCWGTRTETEGKSEENTQRQEQKHESTEDTFQIDLNVQGLPVSGIITRTSRTIGEKTSDEVKSGTQSSLSKTTIEMPPEFKILMGQMGQLLKLAGNLGLPGGQVGGSFLSKMGTLVTSPEGLMTAGTGAGGTGMLLMQWQRRRLKEQLEKKEKEVSDDYEKDVKQMVKAIDGFLTDPSITQDCKDLLKTYLSKHMDQSAKDLVRALRGT